MWIGESRDCKREIFELKWPNRLIKCLGVYITCDYDEFIKLNYKQHLKKMEKTATWWKGRVVSGTGAHITQYCNLSFSYRNMSVTGNTRPL